ncbi:GNAT family N-acetyltransferase [Enterococcus dongliensis]|uniref:GNAT family N-acetyltransferase n=1 Tax=Enterococcus dongliensis TaxID=2559925 RepID=UPI00288CCE2B|nr:GNAT family N-acetyltransferase [Enterococcus dongliensis]MDT2612174.1 GNAT family N-acetyltransferase [Enterococcus dongliensis]
MEEYFGASPKLQAAAFYLRYKVFVLEQHISPDLEFDSLDTPDRQYLVFFKEELPIATVRYQKIDEQTLNPDRLCVHPSFRKQGVGKKLLTHLEKHAKNEGCQKSILSAEIHAQNFYESLAYRVVSAPFEEDGITCIKMQKDLESTK